MKELLAEARTSVVAVVVFGALLCGVYPVAVWGLGHALFPASADGSLIARDGKVVGSRLLGQNFSAPQYFHTRPSAAGKGYDAAASSGSNLGPISQKFLDAVSERAKTYRTVNGLAADAIVPADAVTASGSGLDPHISPANAALQAPRVATQRGLPVNVVASLVREYTDGPDLGFLGDPAVNVLELNLALDAAGSAKPRQDPH
jgi:K+-transporting ATPase ATPase C chain